jgi:micrococcal nuclease
VAGPVVAGALKVLAAVAIGGTAAGGIALASGDSSTTAVVTRIVDGDTIDVSYEGDTHRIRLLNIDTPETVDPEEPVECLGPEATAFLRDRLPRGTEVVLRYDEEREDRYERELAGVYVGDSLINAEIARAGLGVAMSVAPNTRFLLEVEAAQEEARSAKRGLYDEDVTCTVPAQLEAAEATAETTTAAPPSEGAGLDAFDAHADELADLAADVRRLARLLAGDPRDFPLVAFTSAEIGRMSRRVAEVAERVDFVETLSRDARAAEQERFDDAQRAAEEAKRKAEEEAARRAADQAAREAAEEQSRASYEGSGGSSSDSSSSNSGSSSSGGGSGSSSGGGYDGYTGCRAYGPGGTSFDEQGRRYTKIDCDTRQPIG